MATINFKEKELVRNYHRITSWYRMRKGVGSFGHRKTVEYKTVEYKTAPYPKTERYKKTNTTFPH